MSSRATNGIVAGSRAGRASNSQRFASAYLFKNAARHIRTRARELRPVARELLRELLYEARPETGVAAVSYAELADACACSVPTVRRKVDELRAAGWIAIEHSAGSECRFDVRPAFLRLVQNDQGTDVISELAKAEATCEILRKMAGIAAGAGAPSLIQASEVIPDVTHTAPPAPPPPRELASSASSASSETGEAKEGGEREASGANSQSESAAPAPRAVSLSAARVLLTMLRLAYGAAADERALRVVVRRRHDRELGPIADCLASGYSEAQCEAIAREAWRDPWFRELPAARWRPELVYSATTVARLRAAAEARRRARAPARIEPDPHAPPPDVVGFRPELAAGIVAAVTG